MSNPTTPLLSGEELKELQALCDGATDGPWRTSGLVPHAVFIDTEAGPRHVTASGPTSIGTPADAAFIAAAREALPKLLAENARLQALVDADPDWVHTEDCESSTSWMYRNDILDRYNVGDVVEVFAAGDLPSRWVAIMPSDDDSDHDAQWFRTEEEAKAAIGRLHP